MPTITADRTPVADNPHGVDVRHLFKTKDVVVEIEGETIAASAGTLVPSSAGHLHSIRNESDCLVRFLVVKTPNPAA
ncbi:MAG: hypothetical protein NTX16_04000 [Actinobacteria bacterium]|nr:hypothetical protein [Actinomycetota bacterium]